MNYSTTLDYLYHRLPCYQRIGQAAYKENLDNTLALLEHMGNPHKKLTCIHIAGTNGKGSVSHMCASIFQEAGYKTGLYTSPHLIDFRERIQINGIPIPKKYISSFITKHRVIIEIIKPSFFEITVALCYAYFAHCNIDIAIIETGLGGRLDSTNVITPILSIITNISYDHTHLLGNTIEKIAFEKAGIIKPNIPILIGEYQKNTAPVFFEVAHNQNSPIYFADTHTTISYNTEKPWHTKFTVLAHNKKICANTSSPLHGAYQQKNIKTVCAAIELLQKKYGNINSKHIKNGIENTITNTHLLGRWQLLQSIPYIVCDTAHNYAGIQETMSQLASMNCNDIHIIWGMVSDKDVATIIELLPKRATYYLTKPSIERAMNTNELASYFIKHGFTYTTHTSVKQAYTKAAQKLTPQSILYIGGSTFVVADAILYHTKKRIKKK